MLSKIDNKCYKYYKARINIKKAFDYILNDNSKINNLNYLLSNNLKELISNFYFLLQNDISLILQFIELSKKEDYEELSDFLVHFLFINLIKNLNVDEKLNLIIYLLQEKIIINDLPDKIEINSNIPYTYLKNTFLFHIFKSLTRKNDIRNFLRNIFGDFILRFENLKLTLSTKITDVNQYANLRNGFIYRSFINSIGTFKEEEIHQKKKKIKNYQNKNKEKLTIKKARKVKKEISDENNNEQKVITLAEKLKPNTDIFEDFEIIEKNENVSDEDEKNKLKKRDTNSSKLEEKEEKKEIKKENKINFEHLLKIENSKSTSVKNNENKIINPLSISKGISEKSSLDPKEIIKKTSEDIKIPVDDFFKENDLTKEKINQIHNEYKGKAGTKNNLNSAMIEFLNNINNQEVNDFSSSLYINELILIGSNKFNQNYFDLMRKIRINFRIISKVITNIISDLTKNITSIPYIIKLVIKIIGELLKKKYSQEKGNNLTPYQLYMFKISFLFGNIILPILENPYFNGIVTSQIISEITQKNIKIVYDIFDKMITGKLFNRNETPSMVLYNKFIIETLPKLFEVIDNIEQNIELPKYIDKFINGDSIKRNLQYDYFDENPKENIQYQSGCISILNLKYFFDLLISNKKILIDMNENQEKKAILNDFINKKKFINDIYNNNQVENKRDFFYFSKFQNADELKKEMENIFKDNNYGIIPPKNNYLISLFKYCLNEILNYTNIIQYENFYDLSELKNEKIMKVKSKIKEEETEKNNKAIDTKNLLKASLIKILDAKKEDDVDFKNIIFPHVRRNILFEMNKDKNVEFNQHIIFCANYLQMHIGELPKEYIENNYSLLFNELINEIKIKKKVTWGNIIFEFYKKIKEAERFIMKESEFSNQITDLENLKYLEYLYKNISIPTNIKIKKDKQDILITKLQFIIKKSDVKEVYFPYKYNTIEEIIKNFPNFREYENNYDNILDIEKNVYISNAINYYFKEMGKVVEKELIKKNMVKTQIVKVKCLLGNYIMNKLFDKTFPTQISEEDLFIFKKCERLSFLKPENIIPTKESINENLLNEAIKCFKKLDDNITPFDKLRCIEKGTLIIKNSIAFNTGKKDFGFDDTINHLVYAMLKAKPKNLATNAQYCELFFNTTMPKYYKEFLNYLLFIKEVIKEKDY